MPTTHKKRRTDRRAMLLFLPLLAAATLILALSGGERQPARVVTVPSGAAPSVSGTAPEGDQDAPDGDRPSADDPLLLLVNREHPLPDDFSPNLTRLHDWDLSVAEAAYGDLCNMLEAGRAEGLRFWVCSAYRSRETQRELFDEDVERLLAEGLSRADAVEQTARYTMPPGCSEHESGLALDIVALDNQLLDESQEDTPETRWLHAHCAEYGFVLRYPSEKSELTGIDYEPWHYRYVGAAAAQWLTEHDMTLEEFWASEGGTETSDSTGTAGMTETPGTTSTPGTPES